ncbi:cystathionine gamma-synthase [Dethiosulfatibacter aminovorans DSM 17477]|uniref:homocysteine desulfhydrase n=1 Tax=Dethiosulfatibacter aminovorans DSM 17477 TaxID=1121476 RepID=A0A1M6JY72_9FIRM|nr:aminotransferase class I/II-fold pyridoxal phosphate-dependent enzyme [Dethiosulfatibacter aminovorans]SHJ51677.1 cystathionine gamma-synthase [Dethiosulfatibacter aminovorans DSM 17477]
MDTKFMTELTHLGASVDLPSSSRPKVAPIYMSSAYVFDSSKTCNDVSYERKEGYLYGSYGNPTTDCLKEIIQNLECGEAAEVFSSGMSAITLAIMSQVKSGDHIIANSVIYGNSFKFLKSELEGQYNIEVTMVDLNEENLHEYFKDNTKLVYAESISNPLINVLDIERISKIAHDYGAKLLVDNTFATPIVCQPLKLGADIVVHSATKFLNGHSDIMAGIVVSTKEVMDRVIDLSRTYGPIISPFDAWLLTRSMRTLELRVNKHCDNAMKLARYLESNDKIGKVFYPGLESFEDHGLATEIFNNGQYGAMLAVDLGSLEMIEEFIKRSKLAKIVASLGSFTTSLCDTTITHSGMTREERIEMGLPDGLLRISTGLENIEDIIEEFDMIINEIMKEGVLINHG